MGIIKYATSDVIDFHPGPKHWARTAHRADFSYKVRPGFVYVRSRAVSSRTNDNFDTFEADELRLGWKTFLGRPSFVNHHNEDIRQFRGVIIDAALHEDQSPDGSDDVWVETLMEIDGRRYPRLATEILEGRIGRTSMGCFLPGTRITMSDGSKKSIESIAVNDEVITHTGGTERVVYVMEREHNGLVYDIRAFGQERPLVATEEHPFWVRRADMTSHAKARRGISRGKVCVCGREFASPRSMSAHLREARRRGWPDRHERTEEYEGYSTNGSWIEAKDVQVGDWVLTPSVDPSGVSTDESRSIAILLGYYAAEGSIGYDKKNYGSQPRWVQWDFHEKESEYFQEVSKHIASLGFTPSGPYFKNSSASIRCYSPALAEEMLRLGGKLSYGKKFHQDVFSWDRDDLYELLVRYWNGDGHYYSEREYVVSTTVSQTLAEQLYLISASCGVAMSPPDTALPPAVQKLGQRTRYTLQCNPNRFSEFERIHNHDRIRVDEHGTWRQVTSISIKSYSGLVYNFDVDGDDSYVAEDVAVHNCNIRASQCSACGNLAETVDKYCAHVASSKGSRIPRYNAATGTTESVLVHEFLKGLNFFENSILVEDPADPTAYLYGVDGTGLHMAMSTTAATSVPRRINLLHTDGCPVCGANDWDESGQCGVCGYETPPEPFENPDLDAASRVPRDGTWFSPSLVKAPAFQQP